MTRSKILGIGSYVPEWVVTNDDLRFLNDRLERCDEVQMETSHEWIVERTGIEARRYSGPGVTSSDLAVNAAASALADADVEKSQVDCLILATLSPDIHFPGTGVFVQDKMGMDHHPACYDIRQQCSGFLYGLQMADALIRSGTYKRVLLIGTESHSRGIDHSTRGRDVTVIFGDGAGAVLLGPDESNDPRSGVIYTQVAADGAGAWELYMKLFDIGQAPMMDYDCGNFETNVEKYPQMNGRKVFINAVKRMTETTLTALKKTEMSWDDIDWFVPHQANLRITEAVAAKAGIPTDKVLNTIQFYGNTTAATIPLTIDHWYNEGKVSKGDMICASVFGAGFTWGSAIFRLG